MPLSVSTGLLQSWNVQLGARQSLKAGVELRRFEADYSAKPTYLIENYRSTRAIIDAANRVIEQMVAVGGNSPQLHILFSQAHYERGEVDKALEELRAALALDNKIRLAHFYMGLIHLKAGKFPDAARDFCDVRDVVRAYHVAIDAPPADQIAPEAS